MGVDYSEAELEAALVDNIRAFLIEMGGDFAFVGNQHHLEVDDDSYFIDLSPYHRRLQSLTAIELKIGEFISEHAGKMRFYLTALDETVKLPHENPSIGIIVCKSKKRTRVEHTLSDTNKPVGAATYSYYGKLPESLLSLLSTPDEIAAVVQGLDINDV
jgi:hypothetical protein